MELRLVAPTVEILRADFESDSTQLAQLLSAEVVEWPPSGGEWDSDAIAFFLSQLQASPLEPNAWGPYYVIVDGELVASGGFFGPPDAEAQVEIGYSVCSNRRRRGIGTALVRKLSALAIAEGLSVRAQVEISNAASISILRASGFIDTTPETHRSLGPLCLKLG